MNASLQADFNPERVSHVLNQHADKSLSFADGADGSISHSGMALAKRQISSWSGYHQTPLVSLQGLADELGISSLHYKDEGGRFSLGSFKALGGAYAVYCLMCRQIEAKAGMASVSAKDLIAGLHSSHTADLTVCSATDGNHGRSVAWGARQFGCKCVIYIHAEVSEGREKSLAELGATVIRVDGNYDDSVHFCAREAEDNGWFVVSDTSYDDYTVVPTNVMEGYSVLGSEIVEQLGASRPTHVFVQGGVGGLAAAVCAAFWQAWGNTRPRFVIVEPDLAPCLFASAQAGKPTVVDVTEETIMAGLSCGEVSMIAWDILSRGSDNFMTIPDDFVGPAMRLLAGSDYGDEPVVAGESAVAGLAGMISARCSVELSASLHMDKDSRVLVIGSEGATDVGIYKDIVGDLADGLLD